MAWRQNGLLSACSKEDGSFYALKLKRHNDEEKNEKKDK